MTIWDVAEYICIGVACWTVVSIILGITVGPVLGRRLKELHKYYPEVNNRAPGQGK